MKCKRFFFFTILPFDINHSDGQVKHVARRGANALGQVRYVARLEANALCFDLLTVADRVMLIHDDVCPVDLPYHPTCVAPLLALVDVLRPCSY